MSSEKKKNVVDILLIFFSFVPFLNTFTLLHFGGRIREKKFTRNGWIILFVNIVLMIIFILTFSLEYVRVAEIPYDKEPNVYDYVDRKEYDAADYSERKNIEGYYEYQEAYDKWKNSEEYLAAYRTNNNFHAAVRGLRIGVVIASLVVNMIVFFYMISRKQYYFDRLNAPSYAERTTAYERIKDVVSAPDVLSVQAPSNDLSEKNVQEAPAQQINIVDVNTASEEEIAALPGLTIIDAKRAVDYRRENGPFRTPDEFFEAIRVKPHIMVKIQDRVIASAQSSSGSDADGKGGRVIDL